MGKLGLITDDMTGTMTCGVLLAKKGIKACSYFSEDNLEGVADQDAVILSANSRNLPREQAKANVKNAYKALKNQGAEYFTKRIDTTFRGGIGYEIDALLEELPKDTIAVVAAAMPDTRRILVGGYSIIDGTILTETGAAQDVLSPIKEAHIPTLLRSQSNYKVEEIGIRYVLGDEDTLAEQFKACRARGARSIVVDGITHEHLEKVAHVVCRLGWNVICVDPGAFTQKMALCRGFGNKELEPSECNDETDLSLLREKVLVVAGSATDVTGRQIEVLRKKDYSHVISVKAQSLIAGKKDAAEEIKRIESECAAAMADTEKCVIALETASSGERLNLRQMEEKYGLKSGEASRNINQGLGEIVCNVAINMYEKKELAGIYMTGGDTLVSVLKSLGAAGIRLVDTVQPQTNLGIIIGGRFEGVKIVGKGGLIGSEDTIIKVVNRLFRG